MTNHVSRVTLPDGAEILISTVVAEDDSETREAVSEKSFLNADLALDGIKGFAKTMFAVIQDVAPTKAAIEFSADFTVESGKMLALICDGKSHGSVKITLEWKKLLEESAKS